MASAGRISSDAGETARGLINVRSVLGQSLENLRRWVQSDGEAIDPFGHGLTQFRFERGFLSVRPGVNEDHLEISRAPIVETELAPEHWQRFDVENVGKWSRFIGQKLSWVDCFSDGFEDVALVFYFETGDHLALVLCNTDLLLAEGLEPFQDDLEGTLPRFRERIALRVVVPHPK